MAVSLWTSGWLGEEGGGYLFSKFTVLVFDTHLSGAERRRFKVLKKNLRPLQPRNSRGRCPVSRRRPALLRDGAFAHLAKSKNPVIAVYGPFMFNAIMVNRQNASQKVREMPQKMAQTGQILARKTTVNHIIGSGLIIWPTRCANFGDVSGRVISFNCNCLAAVLDFVRSNYVHFAPLKTAPWADHPENKSGELCVLCIS
jgi:hypothetical protein